MSQERILSRQVAHEIKDDELDEVAGGMQEKRFGTCPEDPGSSIPTTCGGGTVDLDHWD